MKKWVAFVLLIACAVGGYFAYPYVKLYFLGQGDNITLEGDEEKFIYIKTGSSAQDVATMLIEKDIIEDKEEFLKLAQAKNYAGDNIVPGKYRVEGTMNNNTFMNHLRAGNGRMTVNVTFNECITLSDVAEQVAPAIEATQKDLVNTFENSKVYNKYGFKTQARFRTMFLPNTYEVYWNTSAQEFVAKMANAYKNFWTKQRKAKARKIGFKQSEITIIASIVTAEQRRHSDEWSKIAGLYINRLRRNWKLQSDPTLVYALGNFDKRRVYDVDKQVESPYNTYKNKGLPPGPIRIVSHRAIDAVLNFDMHDYMYMCAKPGLGSYHNFAETLSAHNTNARKFQHWQNQQGIR